MTTVKVLYWYYTMAPQPAPRHLCGIGLSEIPIPSQAGPEQIGFEIETLYPFESDRRRILDRGQYARFGSSVALVAAELSSMLCAEGFEPCALHEEAGAMHVTMRDPESKTLYNFRVSDHASPHPERGRFEVIIRKTSLGTTVQQALERRQTLSEDLRNVDYRTARAAPPTWARPPERTADTPP